MKAVRRRFTSGTTHYLCRVTSWRLEPSVRNSTEHPATERKVLEEYGAQL